MAAANSSSSFLNSPRSRLPFMVLDLQNAPPRSCTKVTFHQQCYTLVPELTPDDNTFSPTCHSATPSAKNETNRYQIETNIAHSSTANHITNDQPKRTTPTNATNEPRRRRQLPQIPVGRKPLEKLWQKSINGSSADSSLSLSEEFANCNSCNGGNQMTSTPVRASTSKQTPSLRLTRKLSSKMLLEIETDPDSGKALSLRLITEDDSGLGSSDNSTTEGKELGQSVLCSPVLDDEEIRYRDTTSHQYSTTHHHSFTLPTQQQQFSSFSLKRASAKRTVSIEEGGKIITNTSANDSGLSSSLQSPTTTVSSNFSNSVASSTDCDPYSVDKSQVGVRLKVPEATHRALYKFCARHDDQLELAIGDAVHVLAEHEDQWSEGVNLRTGQQGIFPAALVTDLEYSQFTVDAASLSAPSDLLFSPSSAADRLPRSLNFRIKRERYLLDFLGSIEVTECKGEEVLDEAISRVSTTVMRVRSGGDKNENLMPPNSPSQCILEISDIGLRMMDGCSSRRSSKSSQNISKTSEQMKLTSAQHKLDYFFSLMQITFCGYKLKSDVYYFAFITRHPADQSRYAAHVFKAPESTREVAESVGQAFHRFYKHFVEVSLPLETFYLDD